MSATLKFTICVNSLLIALLILPACVTAYSSDEIASVNQIDVSGTASVDDRVIYLLRTNDEELHFIMVPDGSRSQLRDELRVSGYTGDVDDVLDLVARSNMEPDSRIVVVREVIGLLQRQVASLLSQLSKTGRGADRQADIIRDSGEPWCLINWSRPLRQGDSGSDVMALQKFLNTYGPVPIAQSGLGAPGAETGYFGVSTEAALMRFQELYRDDILKPLQLFAPTGYFGPVTQGWIDRLCGKTSSESVSVPLDRLQMKGFGNSCYSNDQVFSEGTRVDGYYADNGMRVSIDNGYFRCEAGAWTPHELYES